MEICHETYATCDAKCDEIEDDGYYICEYQCHEARKACLDATLVED